MTHAQALAQAISTLKAAGIQGAERDARWLLSAATGNARDRITLHLPDSLNNPAPFFDLVARRAMREPVSHLIGGRDFFRRWFKVTPDVLDPRAETEILIEWALKEEFSKVLDLGTGSGCILVTLLAERPKAKGVGTDISDRAVLIAGENAVAHGVADRIVLPMSDWWHDVGGRYDLIVSNPPYIAQSEMAELSPELAFEPIDALTDKADGLTAYRQIAAGAGDHLTCGGRLCVEIGPSQGEAVAELFETAGLQEIEILPDLDGRDRVVSAVRLT